MVTLQHPSIAKMGGSVVFKTRQRSLILLKKELITSSEFVNVALEIIV
jgi:hypothetical protein